MDVQEITVDEGTKVKVGDQTFVVRRAATTIGEPVEVKRQKNRHAAYTCPNTACWPVQVEHAKRVQIWRSGMAVADGYTPRCGFCGTPITQAGYAALQQRTTDGENNGEGMTDGGN